MRLTLLPLGALLVVLAAPAPAADALGSAIDTQVTTQKEAADSQERIDAVAAETHTMLLEFQHATAQTDALKAFDDPLERQIQTQRTKLADFERQLATVRETQREIMPFLSRMFAALEAFVTRDAPFLVEERRTRLAKLEAMMDDPAVGLPERFRRIMEAYQIETEYGRTIEAYSGKLEQDGKHRTVDFLRAGRVALVYATLDGSVTGYWDRASRGWKELPREYGEPVRHALRVARKQSPPDLLRLPIAAAVEAPPRGSAPVISIGPTGSGGIGTADPAR